jgi:arylsulfatase A-like enzyme
MAREYFRSRPDGWPFFLWFTLSKPHQEYKPAREFWDLYGDPIPLPPSADDAPAQKIRPMRRTVEAQRRHPPADLEPSDYASLRQRKMRGYFGNISHMDWAMGEVLNMLEDSGQWRNTLVVYTADHGDFACEHGILEKAPGISSDAICRVPMIWKWPEHFPEGEVRGQLVESLDLWPTLSHLAGLPAMSMWDGKDISSVLTDDGTEVRESAYTENPFIKSVTTQKWRTTWVPDDMYAGDPVRGELYDRENDPWERVNLYHEAGYGSVVGELKDRLLNWLVTSSHPVSAWPVLAHPSMEQAASEHVAGNAPYPEDGRISPARIRRAIEEGRDNYL